MVFTPFEKNIEVWRQLWRVIERSDIVVQIVDARNPLLYRSIDLERYVHEVDESKINLLLINKSDLLTVEQRSLWADYFQSNRITYRFWSAEWAWSDCCDSTELEDSHDHHRRPLQETELDESIRIATRDELLDTFEQLRSSTGRESSITVGMVGYPNVGKSSTINALYGEKKVAVAATPGKTKHFQTLIINDRLCLCDCPGLVFPTVTSTKAELVVNGILSIDQLRDYIGPVSLICQRIPRPLLQLTYGIRLPLSSSSSLSNPYDDDYSLSKPHMEFEQDPSLHWYGSTSSTPHGLLTIIASMRGFMKAGHGMPDESRAARLILKDYVNGKLLYCHPPPRPSSSPSESYPMLDSVRFNATSYDRLYDLLRAKKHLPVSSSSRLSMIEPSILSDPHRQQRDSSDPSQLVENIDMDEFGSSRDNNATQVHLRGPNYLSESIASTRGNFKTRPASKKHFNHTKRQR